MNMWDFIGKEIHMNFCAYVLVCLQLQEYLWNKWKYELGNMLLMEAILTELLMAWNTLIYLLHIFDLLFNISIEPLIDFGIIRRGNEFSRHDTESPKR